MSFDLSQLANSKFWNIPIKEIRLKTGQNGSTYFTCSLNLDNHSASNANEACQCVVKMQTGTFYIQILTSSTKADSSKLTHCELHKLSRNEKLGKLKIQKEFNLIYIYNYFSTGFVEVRSYEKFLVCTIEKLWNSYIQILNEIEDIKMFCEKCLRLISECKCDEDFDVYEKDVEVFEGIRKYKDYEIFDFSDNFFSSNTYRLNPGDSLENYLRHQLDEEKIQNLFKKSEELQSKMHSKSLYLKKYPVNFILCTQKNLEIETLFLAPSFKSKSHFKKYFSSTPESSLDLKSEISKRLTQYQEQSQPLVENYLNIKYLEHPLDSQELQSLVPGFYKIYKNNIKYTNKDIMIHLPQSPGPLSNQRVEQEYLKRMQFKLINNCLLPEKLIKIHSKTGIIYNYSTSLTSSLKNLSDEEKIETMKKVAEIINSIHSKKIFLSSLHPDNIVFYKKKVYLKDFAHSSKTPEPYTYDKNHMVYIDPLALKYKKNSFSSDIWSWAAVFIGLFNNFDPYLGQTDSLKPTGPNDEIKNVIEDFYYEVYTLQIKPSLNQLPQNDNLKQLLRTCINLNPKARPTIKEIIAKLNTI